MGCENFCVCPQDNVMPPTACRRHPSSSRKTKEPPEWPTQWSCSLYSAKKNAMLNGWICEVFSPILGSFAAILFRVYFIFHDSLPCKEIVINLWPANMKKTRLKHSNLGLASPFQSPPRASKRAGAAQPQQGNNSSAEACSGQVDRHLPQAISYICILCSYYCFRYWLIVFFDHGRCSGGIQWGSQRKFCKSYWQ